MEVVEEADAAKLEENNAVAAKEEPVEEAVMASDNNPVSTLKEVFSYSISFF